MLIHFLLVVDPAEATKILEDRRKKWAQKHQQKTRQYSEKLQNRLKRSFSTDGLSPLSWIDEEDDELVNDMLMDSRPSLSLLPARASFDVRGVNRSPPQQAHLKAESASTEGDDDPFKIGIHFPTSTPMFSVPNNLKLRESAKVDKPSPPDRNSRPALSVRFGTESVTVYAKNAPVRRRSFSLENEIGTIASDPRNTHSRGDLPPHLRASRKPVPSCSAPVTPRSPRAKQPVSADTVASTCSPGSSN